MASRAARRRRCLRGIDVDPVEHRASGVGPSGVVELHAVEPSGDRGRVPDSPAEVRIVEVAAVRGVMDTHSSTSAPVSPCSARWSARRAMRAAGTAIGGVPPRTSGSVERRKSSRPTRRPAHSPHRRPGVDGTDVCHWAAGRVHPFIPTPPVPRSRNRGRIVGADLRRAPGQGRRGWLVMEGQGWRQLPRVTGRGRLGQRCRGWRRSCWSRPHEGVGTAPQRAPRGRWPDRVR